MANNKLQNYLRACRKRAGLSQEDIAYLLGFDSAHVSRYERFRRTPGFRIALAFEVIFNTSIRDLFSGDYHKVEKAICRRAKRLAKRLDTGTPDPVTARKLNHLRRIVSAIERK
jgi:transcriptional regulator with XRE-family HTH domain